MNKYIKIKISYNNIMMNNSNNIFKNKMIQNKKQRQLKNNFNKLRHSISYKYVIITLQRNPNLIINYPL